MKGNFLARIGLIVAVFGMAAPAFAQSLCGPYAGDQNYTNPVILNCDTTLGFGSSFTFGSTVDGAYRLGISGSGPITFNGAVGDTTQLTSLTTTSGTFFAGALNISGGLSVTTGSSGISQGGAFNVGGASTFNAGSQAIALANAGNDFSGAVTATGSGVSIVDMNDLTIASLTESGNGNVSLTAGGALTVPAINAGTGNLTLVSNGGVLMTTGALSGGNAFLTGRDEMVLSADMTATGQLQLTTTNAAVAQVSGRIRVAGTTTVNASAIELAGGSNDFTGAVNLIGVAASVTDSNSLTLGTLSISALTVNSTGALNLGTGSISGDLSATSNGGATTQSGALLVSGSSTIDAGSGAIMLINAGNDFGGAISLRGSSAQITDSNALTLGALITGALTVNSTGALNLGTGSINGNLSANSSNGAITQSGGLSVAGSSTIDAGMGAIMLINAGNDFGGTTSLSGGSTLITDANTLTLGALTTGALTVTSVGALNLGAGSISGNLSANSNHGAIAQAGNLAIAGLCTLGASESAITISHGMTCASLAFTGAVSVGGALTLSDDGGSGIVSGTYMQSNSGTLAMHAGPGGSGHLEVTGNASLDGTLSVAFSAPPANGFAVPLLSAGSLAGAFANVQVAGLAADQSAIVAYTPTGVLLTIKAAQAITFTSIAPINAIYNGPAYTIAATATSGLPVAFTLNGSSTGCSLSAATVSFTGVGTCVIDANQTGDGSYMAAASVQQIFSIGQASQAISNFAATPANPTYAPDGTFSVSATGGGSGNPVTFATTTPSVCMVGGSTVTMLSAGNCALVADQGGDTNHTAAPQVTLDVNVGQAGQAITDFIATPTSPTYAPGGTFSVSATGGASGNPVLFGSTTPGVCTVGGLTVTMLSAGNCALTADQAGDANYTAAPQTALDVGIGQAEQAITDFIATPASPTYAPGGTFSVSATGGASGNVVIFGSTTADICSVSGSIVTMLSAGNCALTADQVGDVNYAAASQTTLDVGIGQIAQTIADFIATPDNPIYEEGGSFSVSATGGTSGNPVTFDSNTAGVCTVSGSIVTMHGAGSCLLTADQAGDDNYAAAPQVTLDVDISQIAQTITDFIATPTNPIYEEGGSFGVSATGGASGNPVTFASTTPGVCTVAGSTVTMHGAGNCGLTADQVGDTNYAAAAQVTLDVGIGQVAQTILFDPLPDVALDRGSATVVVAASSGLPVTLISETPGVCDVAGGGPFRVSLLAVGTCTLTAVQAGDANTAPVTASASFLVVQAVVAVPVPTLNGWMLLMLAALLAMSALAAVRISRP